VLTDLPTGATVDVLYQWRGLECGLILRLVSSVISLLLVLITRTQELRHSIKTNTVDKLKQIISGFNDEISARLARVGKKQDLIDRITNSMDNVRRNNLEDQWNRARAVLYQVRNTG
jgi:hypothetical protein